MIREIMHDPEFLAQKSEMATEEDKQVVEDMLDTLRAHLDGCVGMAANMIGVRKNIIVACKGDKQVALINVTLVKKAKPYITKEGCLSLPGIKKTVRYDEIEIDYLTEDFKPKHSKFTGFFAQIIQHELDHINGILI